MSDPWRLAKSLVVLRSEIEARYPGTTVWTIGDQSHQSGASDHNPNDAGVVCAIDVKGDGGMDLGAFAEHLKRFNHRAVKYVIFNRRIWSKARDSEGWRYYGGSNPHATHVHVSVGVGPDGRSTGPYDDTSPWGIASVGHGTVPSSGVPEPTLREGDEGYRVGKLQRALNGTIGAGLDVDGDFGPATAAAVRVLQERAGITRDEIYGPATARALADLLEDDMDLDDKIHVTDYTTRTWGREELDVETALSHTYTYARNASDYASAARTEQAKQTALLQQIAAGQSGLSEDAIAAAVEAGVRQAIDPTELAAAVAGAVDHDLDTAAVEEALRRVLGGVDEAG